MLVRPKGKSYEIVAGHRRRRAAEAVGFEVVPCLVKAIDDREALEMLVVENLEREELDPVEEARGVRHLLDAGMTAEEIASRIKRQLRWVRTRQLILDLPGDAQEALRLPKEHDRHLHVGTVQLLLDLDEEDRDRALQMVLHPEFELRTLSPRQAADAIEQVIVRPKRQAAAWDAGREALGKEWRRELRKAALPGTAAEVQVSVPTWEEWRSVRAGRNAQERVDRSECRDGAPEGLLWQHVATRHGLAIRILPEEEDGLRSRATVDEVLLRQAEEALLEHGGEAWLMVGRKIRQSPPEDDGEEPQVVIDQQLESHAVVDMGRVRQLKAWLQDTDADLNSAPDFVPKWCQEVIIEGGWERAVEICEWIEDLKHACTC